MKYYTLAATKGNKMYFSIKVKVKATYGLSLRRKFIPKITVKSTAQQLICQSPILVAFNGTFVEYCGLFLSTQSPLGLW